MKTLETLSAELEAGQVTAVALVEQCLAKIADKNGQGGKAFLRVDVDLARETARYIDLLRRHNARPSRYAGIPISVKDLFDIAGEVTTAGSVVLRENAPATTDATAISRLKSKGFIVVGRTNMTEFAYSGIGLNPHYGTPLSPYDRKTGRVPGGSSSGAAVSVSDGMCAVGIGTDTGGSCRVPASYCGVVGYKPSVGRIPTDGAYPLSFTLDSIGSLANSVQCAATVDAAMAGDWNGEFGARPAATLRFGVLKTLVTDDLEASVAQAFSGAISKLSQAGFTLMDVELKGIEQISTINSRGGIVAVEACTHHRAQIEQHGERYDPRVKRRILSGLAVPAPDYVELLQRRKAMISSSRRAMSTFDGLLMPTTANAPPPMSAFAKDDDYNRLNSLCLRNSMIANFLNCCAISIPIHRRGEPPAGLMIMAPWGSDRLLFAAAAAMESVCRGWSES